jgi:1-aminocyclopropane-1-carboxylate deaminase/D-cysteine desulfhydrase-like pyridoxal-dependent ACC family enzyme
VAGCQLFELAAQVIGISPDDPADSITGEVNDIICGIAALYDMPLREEATVLDEYIGPGYGIDSPESIAALELLARTEGLLLDPVLFGQSDGRLARLD